jgi:hypothetical protein
VIVNNDLGWRGFLVAQLVMVLQHPFLTSTVPIRPISVMPVQGHPIQVGADRAGWRRQRIEAGPINVVAAVPARHQLLGEHQWEPLH